MINTARTVRLVDLGIPYTSLRRLQELGEITNLKFLTIHDTEIFELEGVEKYLFLERLDISNTAVKDFSLLNELAYFKTLIISEDMEQYLYTLSRDDIEIVIK